MREEAIPFIGDIVFVDRGAFEGSCVGGNLSVSDLNIQDNIFEVELNLRSAVEKDRLNQEGASVVIGIDVEINTRDNQTLPGSLNGNMLQGRPETVDEPKNIRLKIISTLLKKIEKTYTGIVEIRDRNLQFQDFILHSMKVVPGAYFASACSIMDFSSTSPKMSANGVDFLTMMEDASTTINDLWNSIQKISFCVTRDDCHLIDELHREFLLSKHQFMFIIQDVAEDRSAHGILDRLLNVECQCKLITDFFKDLKYKLEEVTMKYRKKAQFWKILLEDGIEFLGGDSSMSKYLKENDMNVFLIFLSESFDHKSIFSNINYVYTLMNDFQKRSIFLVIDLDVVDVADVEGFVKVPKGPAIYHYKNKLLSEDVIKDLKKKTGTGFVYFTNCVKAQLAPERRTVLTGKCPGKCSGKIIEWRCAKCKTVIEYDFDKRFYCDCGGYEVENCKYKCSDYKHGEPVSFRDMGSLYSMLGDLSPLEEVNILLIGASGVGKSTWINGIVNYLTFKSLAEAEQSDVIAVVPTQFTISDEEFKTHHISVGEDKNEAQIVGASATQGCRSYAIVTKDRIIRLIDTPGIGDTRGYEQDSENIAKIVQHLQHVKKIHGICFLVKPNETRLEACFQFCIKELFSFLHKKARNNVVFCFTNSRSTNYKPANSQPLIEKILEDAKTNIGLHENTIYCFDNESFRFLCAVKNNLNFTKDERESFANSWKRSVKETNRLIANVSRLEPYDVASTKTIADLRHKMSMVIDALGEIAKNSETFTIQSLESQRSDYSRKITDLNNSANVQETVLRQKTVSGDIVCTNPSCTEKFNNDTIYKTRCCEGCQVSTRYETVLNNELLSCKVLSGLTCTVCTCRWEQHMITKYRQVKETKTKVSSDVQDEIDKTRRLQAALQLQLVKARREVDAEESEKKALIDFGSQIFRYLKNQSLILYNDSLKDYLEYLISSEESKPDKKEIEKTKIKKLNELKNKHEEEVKIADAVKSENSSQVTFRDIANEEVFVEMYKHYRKKPNKYAQVLTHSQKIIRLKNV